MPSFSLEFIGDMLLAPERILGRHTAKQGAQILGQGRLADGPGLPVPEQLESSALPRIRMSGWTLIKAPRQAKNRLRVAMIQRVESFARRGLTFRSRYRASCLRRNRFSATN
jgi:hypothetical protein